MTETTTPTWTPGADRYATEDTYVLGMPDRWAFGSTRVYGYRWDDERAPEGGERISLSDLSAVSEVQAQDYGVLLLEIPSAYIDAIHGDLLGRSNYERLLEDFPGAVIEVTSTYSDSLMIRVGSEVPGLLLEALAGLEDYPLYDEEDHSRREWEAFEETVMEALEFAARSYDDDIDEEVLAAVGAVYAEVGNVCRAEEVDWDQLATMLRERVSN